MNNKAGNNSTQNVGKNTGNSNAKNQRPKCQCNKPAANNAKCRQC